ncbi:hypothetical protein GCM10007977_097990 [Dactylosporangium sucinum]|uniref:Uncharacterized protein n=1 Tax=Dactylosporangium sucinum TaxID=1424081 RepID=A0A917X6R1_9ACTN|nr:hypothetical protein GCM10007977_097990 [Dactylosporangium sucinum]
MKIAGSEMITMDALTVAMSMPTVVFDSTDQPPRSAIRPLSAPPGRVALIQGA